MTTDRRGFDWRELIKPTIAGLTLAGALFLFGFFYAWPRWETRTEGIDTAVKELKSDWHNHNILQKEALEKYVPRTEIETNLVYINKSIDEIKTAQAQKAKDDKAWQIRIEDLLYSRYLETSFRPASAGEGKP